MKVKEYKIKQDGDKIEFVTVFEKSDCQDFRTFKELLLVDILPTFRHILNLVPVRMERKGK